MSGFGRSFLRLAAVAALRNATLVGENVFDSRIAALDPETAMPNLGEIAGSIGVYTEQDDGDALSSGNGGPPFRPQVELILEIAMQARLANEDGSYTVGTPETDGQLEATLDAIESQAELALFRRMEAASVAFRLLTKQPSKKTSIRFTSPGASAKLASRYVTYTVEIADPEIPIFDDALTGLNRLPSPWREVALSWPADSVEREIATQLAALMTAPALPDLLEAHVTLPDPPTVPPADPANDPRVETWDFPT